MLIPSFSLWLAVAAPRTVPIQVRGVLGGRIDLHPLGMVKDARWGARRKFNDDIRHHQWSLATFELIVRRWLV